MSIYFCRNSTLIKHIFDFCKLRKSFFSKQNFPDLQKSSLVGLTNALFSIKYQRPNKKKRRSTDHLIRTKTHC